MGLIPAGRAAVAMPGKRPGRARA